MLSATECAASESSAGDPAIRPPTALATAISRLAPSATITVTRVLLSEPSFFFRSGSFRGAGHSCPV